MILNALIIGIIAGVGYYWSTKGYLSAFLNFICVVAAGAIAFAAWEPAAHLLLEKLPTTGFLSGFRDGAWAIALGVPFAGSLALLRLASDGIVRANTGVHKLADFIGGGLCGVGAGTIVAGMLVLSLGFLRTGGDFFGVKPVDFDSNGSPKRVGGVWVPADAFVAKFYGTLSETTFRAPDSLARWYPHLPEAPAAMRLTYEGSARNVMAPGDVSLVGRYTVGENATDLNSLLIDRWDSLPQKVTDLNGDPFPPGSRIEAFWLRFGPGAVEKEGKVVIGNGQVRLVVENADEERLTIHPFAMISQAASDVLTMGRWRFDGRDTFIASVGGGQEPRMALEFLVPRGYRPIALYVKNIRLNLDDDSPAAAVKPESYATPAERDAVVYQVPATPPGTP